MDISGAGHGWGGRGGKRHSPPNIMKDTIHFIQKPYYLRNDPELQRRRNRSDIRSANSLEIFKEKIKFWTTDKCPCRLCKTYIGNVGFI